MPNLLDLMNRELGSSSREYPLLEIGGWKFFVDNDGFLPSPCNLCLVAKIFAMKDGADHFYAASIGNSNPESVVRYEPEKDLGKDLSHSFVTGCKITHHFYTQDNWAEALKAEIQQCLRRLSAFVCMSESIAVC